MILKENKSLNDILGSLISEHKIYSDATAHTHLIQLKFNVEEFNVSSKFDEEVSKHEKNENRINLIKEYISSIGKELLSEYSIYDTKIVNNSEGIPLECYITVLETDKKDTPFYEVFNPSYGNQISVFEYLTHFDIQLLGTISNIKELNIIIATAFKTMLSEISYTLWSKFSIIEYSNGFTSIKTLKI